MGELIFHIILLIGIAVLFSNSFIIPIWDDDLLVQRWPQFFLVLAFVIIAYKSITIWKKIPAAEKRFDPVKVFGLKDRGIQKLLITFVGLILYVVLLKYLGFFIMTIVFAAFISLMLGAKPIRALLVGMGVTIVIYAIFVWGLNVRPPRGAVPIYYFSLWLERLL